MAERIDPLAVLRDGLPGRSAEPRHVVIVGAGIAGLTAGLLLKEAGHRVTILEARNRLGGRIYTYRGFAGRMYGEFGAMRFPRQHRLGQHLIHERFGLATTPFGMEDPDTFVHLNGKRVRRSEVTLDSFDFGLPEHEKGRDPKLILREAMQPLIDLIEEPDGWERLIERYDRYSLLGWLVERGVSEQALSLMGPLFNLEGRYHFSLVEWFSHWHEDVFGDLEFITEGSDRLPEAFSPALLDDTRLGAEVNADRAAPGRGHGPLAQRGRRPAERRRRRVHPDGPVRAPAPHGDHRPRRREVVHDPERLLRPRPQDLHAVQPPVRGSRTTTSSTASRSPTSRSGTSSTRPPARTRRPRRAC